MDRMSERIDKNAERLDHVENRVSAAEDGQTELAGGQMKLNRELSALKLKVEDMEDRRQLQQLESDLSQLERDHSDTADARILGQVHTKIQEYQETAYTEIQHLGKYTTARVYGEGDRPGAVLAGLVRPQRGKNTIVTIQSEGGEEIKDPECIADRFREYYQSLYSSRVNPNPEAVTDYLTHIAMPRLPQADRDALSAPLTLGEISEALGGPKIKRCV
ncbi:hypothetical protein NDU88_010103 [Pleurodeles waltl]|uniref:Uncharacterized protein n=1 Tax=Pleurodeles waltl TaxID=8319 RepID=A0AAV7QVF0_PLEWA|nr:hypothetical protein NDU88_010103 [Pleurodeles waltl]